MTRSRILPFFPAAKYNADTDLGLPPARENETRNYVAKKILEGKIKKYGKNKALFKHRQWLKTFEKEQTQKKLKQMEEALKKEENVKKVLFLRFNYNIEVS